MKLLLSLAATAGLALVLAACAPAAAPAPAPAQGGPSSASPASTAPATAAGTSPAPIPETAPALPVSTTDKDGRPVQVRDLSRIVVANGDLAEVVWALGLGDQVVATDTSATYPEEARARQVLGYQRSLSAEGILSRNPTLVLASQSAGPPAVLEQVRGAGVPVLVLETRESEDAAAAKIRAVGAALGVPQRAEVLARQVEADTQEARALGARAASQPRVAFLYLRGANSQFVGGAGTSADVTLRLVNARNAAAEAGLQGFVPLTAESLAAMQPDVIVLPSASLAGIGGVDGLLRIPGIAQTPAGQNRRIVDMDDQYLLGFGPRSGQAFQELARAIHPELR